MNQPNAITKEEFNNIKSLLNSHSEKEVVKISGRSRTAVRVILETNDWNDFKLDKLERNAKINALRQSKGRPSRARTHKKVKYTHLSEEDFKALKDMLNYGLSKAVISTATGRALSTLSYIDRTETFEKYNKLRESYRKPKVVEPPKEILHVEVKEEPVNGVFSPEIKQLLEDAVKALHNVDDSLRLLESSNKKLEERVVNTEDYIKTFAEAVAERRGLLGRR